MNDNTFFALISRMKHINRWGLMHNSRYESLMEHSFETAYIANALANIENTMFGGSYDAERIAACALFHDSAEIITGDMPTPVKYQNERISGAYAQAERHARDTLVSALPEPLRDTYRGYLYADDSPEYAIIKAADKLSALIKCMEESGGGNRDFMSAEKATREWLAGCKLGSVRYFTEHMLHAYALTLDELTERK